MITTNRYETMTWLDVDEPTESETTSLAEQFSLDSDEFDEAHRHAARPTLEVSEDHAYMVVFAGNLAEIDIYLGPDWIVTIRHANEQGTLWSIDESKRRFERNNGHVRTPGLLLMFLLDRLVDGYFDATDQIEDELEDIEDRIFAEDRVERDLQQRLFKVRRRLLELRRVVMPLRDVLAAMDREDVPWVDGEALHHARDAYNKLLRAVDVVDEQRELVGNAVDAHLAMMSNQMNLVMKKLTAWGSIVFGATLIAGIYGMNFTHMPELDWKLGYPFALGLMLFTSAIQYRIFKKRDWL